MGKQSLPNFSSFLLSWLLKTDFEYLKSAAGDTEVLVEPIHPTSKQYGTDVERASMPFRDFLTSLEKSDGPYHYMTTQYSEQDEEEHRFETRRAARVAYAHRAKVHSDLNDGRWCERKKCRPHCARRRWCRHQQFPCPVRRGPAGAVPD